MSTIQDEAWSGTLNDTSLRAYLASDPSAIDKVGGAKKVTALAAACWAGRLDIVRLLFDNKANPNGPSPNNRTPFFYVTTRSPSANRSAIAQALIQAGAGIDSPCDEDGNTPLMNAITQTKDREIVHLLVDSGASLTVKNANGQTAVDLAKANGMERDLRPKAERNTSRSQIVDLIVSMVLLIVSYTNTLVAGTVAGGIVKQLYKISGSRDPELEKEIPEPKTVEDFKKNLNLYIKGKTFAKFFAPNDPFLQTLAEKASALTKDSSTDLGKPENIGLLTRLSLYEPVIYCDDSLSMRRENRYTNQTELVGRIARIATRIVPDDLKGVGLHFINSSSSSQPDAKTIETAMNQVRPAGDTAIGTNLRSKILEPLVYKVIDGPTPLKRPILVCTITDGDPSEESRDTLKNMILECKKKLVDAGYEATAVMFSVSQIGANKKAAAFLTELRDDPRLKQVLYVTSDQLDKKLEGLKQNERGLESWLLRVLTGPIVRRDLEQD